MKHRFALQQILALFLFFIFQSSFAAEKGMKLWRIKDLAEIPAAKVNLRDKRERLIKTIDIKQMVYIYAAMKGIEEVAEINATLLLVEGKDPNAFATVADGEAAEIKISETERIEGNIVAINFGMLELFGMDMNAAAAIIGHELAHLKLGHIEEAKKAQKKSQNNNVFSASGTKYTRDNERESDYLGVIWSIEAGYDPGGAVLVHEQLYKLSKRRTGSFVGSHPSSIERITILKSLVRRLSK